MVDSQQHSSLNAQQVHVVSESASAVADLPIARQVPHEISRKSDPDAKPASVLAKRPLSYVYPRTPTAPCPELLATKETVDRTIDVCICDQMRSEYDAICLKLCRYQTVTVALIKKAKECE